MENYKEATFSEEEILLEEKISYDMKKNCSDTPVAVAQSSGPRRRPNNNNRVPNINRRLGRDEHHSQETPKNGKRTNSSTPDSGPKKKGLEPKINRSATEMPY